MPIGFGLSYGRQVVNVHQVQEKRLHGLETDPFSSASYVDKHAVEL